jgi:hypothetical protein
MLVPIYFTYGRHCEEPVGRRSNPDFRVRPWIASSLRSSQ